MINKIEQIESLGIFQDYNTNTELREFARYNLIYGWNGSGKSTLSKLFYSLSEKKACLDFPDAQFSISNNGVLFKSSEIEQYSSNLIVFNEQFIKENIDWNNLVKCLLYISKGKVEEKRKLDVSSSLLLNLNRDVDILDKKNIQLIATTESFLSEAAREIKKQFEVLRTDDKKYINYDKRKLKALIKENDKLRYKRSIVSKKDVEELKIISKLEYIDEIDLNLPSLFDVDKFENIHNTIKNLVKEDIVSKSISTLKSNKEVSNWVETGIIIHKDLKKCKFCDNAITDFRRKKLNAHFNDNFKNLKLKLEETQLSVTKLKLDNENFPTELEVFPFLKEPLYRELNLIRKSIEVINIELDTYIKYLDLKKSNPFDTSIKVKKIVKRNVEDYNKSLNKIKELQKKHNETSLTFENKVNEAKGQLEIYYAHKELKSFKYFDKKIEIQKNDKNIIKLSKKVSPLETEIGRLEASLTDEILGAEEFNTKLHRFLNHRDINLKFDSENKGYQIIRKIGSKTKHATHLSEGEKTAISFVYFLTKLEEDQELLKESIVVIDDPISSFDSNHLFNAYSFIRNVCNNSTQQLFVLTHNFMFFRLIRDWLDGKNKKGKPIKSNFFYLQSDYDGGIRKSKIYNADNTLMHYNSEYHFLFSKIIKYQDKVSLSLEDCFTVANVARKFLEIFLSFKHPKKRNDFMALLNAAVTHKNYETMKDRVYKFINKYSHGDRIESFDDTVDNMMSESKSVVDDFLKIIKHVDKTHYEELVEIAKS